MMKEPNWLVIGLWLFVVNWYTLAYGNDTTCAPGAKAGLWAVIKIHRNDSGHWVSQVELINKKSEEQRNPMDMDVHEYTFRCGNENKTDKIFTTTSVTLLGPRPAAARDAALEARFTAVARVLGRRRLLFFSEARLTWAEARRACAARGMRLAPYSHSNAPAMKLLRGTQPGLWHWNVFVSNEAPGFDPHVDETDSHPTQCPTYDGFKITDVIPCAAKRPFFCQRGQ